MFVAPAAYLRPQIACGCVAVAQFAASRARSPSKMVMYTHAEKRSTDSVDVAKLLSSTVIVDGEMAPLRNALKGEATIIHFVRNGA